MGPARVADVVDRVDEQQVLHVGELVQHGRLEGGRVPGRLDLTDRRRRRSAVRPSRMYQSLVEQPLDQLVHRLPDLVGTGRVPTFQLGDHVSRPPARGQSFPDLGPRALERVVATGLQADEDHLAIHGLVDDLVRIDRDVCDGHVRSPSPGDGGPV